MSKRLKGNDLDWGFRFIMNKQQLLLENCEEFLKQPHLLYF